MNRRLKRSLFVVGTFVTICSGSRGFAELDAVYSDFDLSGTAHEQLMTPREAAVRQCISACTARASGDPRATIESRDACVLACQTAPMSGG